MRQNIFKNTRIGQIQQGMIFNGAVSDSYKNSEVFGIVVTPRCDIENAKVRTYHYLPLVPFADWYYQDFWDILSVQLQKQFHKALSTELEKYKIDSSIMKFVSMNDLIEKNISMITKEKERKKIENMAKKYYSIKEINYETHNDRDKKDLIIRENNSKAKEIIKEIRGNNRKEFYLLEKWSEIDDENHQMNYYIVLIREIRSIPADVARKIGNGLLENDLRTLMNSNLTTKNEDGIIRFHAELSSPFIEHLIQQFSLNFERIGVENHLDGLESMLINL